MTTKRVMLGLLACLGAATGLGAACPPEGEECSAKALRSFSKTFNVQPGAFADLGKLFKVTSGDANATFTVSFDDNCLKLQGPEGFETIQMQIPEFEQQFELQLDAIPQFLHGAFSSMDGKGAPSFAPAFASLMNVQPDVKGKARVISKSQHKSDDKSTGRYVIANDDDTFSVFVENGKVIKLDRNGKDLAVDTLKKDGDRVKMLDKDGTTIFELNLADGAVVENQPVEGRQFSVVGLPSGAGADFFQTEPPKGMIGVQLGEPDGMLLGHFGLDAGEATLVTGVYSGLPAGKAGLKPYDIIVSVNGKKPAGQVDVRAALKGKDAGDEVTLTVIHQGERKDVKVKLTKYDQESLENSKLDAVEINAFALTSGGPSDIMVAPGIGSMRSLKGMDSEQAREFADKMRAQAEEMSKRFQADRDDAARTYRLHLDPAPAAPSAPGAPPAPSGGDTRWQRLEDRLERLEKMIERLAERSKAGAGG